jgi:hypothetical protein
MPLPIPIACATLDATNYMAIGSKAGEEIIVEASFKAIEDYGEDAVMKKGGDKYDAGKSKHHKVTVHARDFPRW